MANRQVSGYTPQLLYHRIPLAERQRIDEVLRTGVPFRLTHTLLAKHGAQQP